MDDEAQKQFIIDTIEDYNQASGFTDIKVTDTPTDALNVVNKKYVDKIPVTLTDAATIATNAAVGRHFRVTLTANRTLGNPTNGVDGGRYVWELIQDGSGSHTISLDTKFNVGTFTITLTTTASKRDFLGAIYNSTTDKYYVVGFVKNY